MKKIFFIISISIFILSYNLHSVNATINDIEETTNEKEINAINTLEDYKNIEEMKKDTSLTEGKYVKTLGYYEENDLGGGTYLISKSGTANGGSVIELENGLKATLQSDESKVSVRQFGAKGDGITDDYLAIYNALNAGFKTVIFDEGTYKSNNSIWINGKDLTIEGNSSKILRNEDWKSDKNDQLILYKAENIDIKNLELEIEKVNSDQNMGLQIGIENSKNITIDNCKLVIPKTVLPEDDERGKSFTNISCSTGWENITIKNCEIINMSDCYRGGSLGFNDIYAMGGKNALVENNIIKYNVKDEAIAIFSHSEEGEEYFNHNTYVQDITIRGNQFYVLDGETWDRDIGFTVGYEDSKKVDNIIMEDNYFEVDAKWAFMTIANNSTNVKIRNNKIKYKQIGDNPTANVFKAGINSKNGNVIENNEIIIQENNGIGIYSIFARKGAEYKNNKVTSNTDVYVVFYYSSADSNIVDVNGNVKKAIGYSNTNITNNVVNINGNMEGNIYESYTLELKEDLNILNNEINIKGTNNASANISLNCAKLNNYKVKFNGNKIKSSKILENKTLAYIQIKDENEQRIEITNNEIDEFIDIQQWGNVYNGEHNVYLANNIIKSLKEHKEHTGGTATCTQKALCGICGEEYGKYDENNHSTAQTHIVNQKNVTYEEDGYTGDLVYDCCNKVKEKGTIVAKLEHKYDEGNNTDNKQEKDNTVNLETDTIDQNSNNLKFEGKENDSKKNKNVNNKGNYEEKKDNSISLTKLPQTGSKSIKIFWIALLSSIISVINFGIKFKKAI